MAERVAATLPSTARRVFVVDASASGRHALCAAIESPASGLAVAGAAARAGDALLRIPACKPDIVVTDLRLGREDGLVLATRIMETCATPTLIVSDTDDPTLAARARQAGALDVCAKLPDRQHPRHQEQREQFLRRLRALSEVKVVTRRHGKAATESAAVPAVHAARAPRVWLIGASTGGPPVLQALLSALPRPFPHPIAIVQHISGGFAPGLAHWLSETTGHRVVVCEQRQALTPGVVHLAPDGRHMRLCDGQTIEPYAAPPRDHQRPSIDVLFESAALHLGSAAGALVLTGMGRDGARGAAALRRRGALVAAQQPSTCAIDAMPRAARDLAGVNLMLAPEGLVALVAGR